MSSHSSSSNFQAHQWNQLACSSGRCTSNEHSSAGPRRGRHLQARRTAGGTCNDRTVQLCSHGATAVDPLQLNDPWLSTKGTLPIHPSGLKGQDDPLVALETRVIETVLAKIPAKPASMEVDEGSNGRLDVIGRRVQELTDGQFHLHAMFQEQSTAQGSQINDLRSQANRLEVAVSDQNTQIGLFQNQFRAQLEQQQGQLDSLFQQQMSRIEEILKKPRHEWRCLITWYPCLCGREWFQQGLSQILTWFFVVGLVLRILFQQRLQLVWIHWLSLSLSCFACWMQPHSFAFTKSLHHMCVSTSKKDKQFFPRGWKVWFFLILMFRVGEAANPGPSPAGNETWSFGIYNPSGLTSKMDQVAHLPGQVRVASETHLTKLGVDKFKQGISSLGSPYQYIIPGCPWVQLMWAFFQGFWWCHSCLPDHWHMISHQTFLKAAGSKFQEFA